MYYNFSCKLCVVKVLISSKERGVHTQPLACGRPSSCWTHITVSKQSLMQWLWTFSNCRFQPMSVTFLVIWCSVTSSRKKKKSWNSLLYWNSFLSNKVLIRNKSWDTVVILITEQNVYNRGLPLDILSLFHKVYLYVIIL